MSNEYQVSSIEKMELIKTIKEAEEKGRQLIEQAKADAAKSAEQMRLKHTESLEEAGKKRKEAIQQAETEGKKQALAEIENLKADADEKHRQMRNNAAGRIEKANDLVMDYLKG